MDTFLKITQCATELEDMTHNCTGAVKEAVSFLLGIPVVPYLMKSSEGTCRLIGRPQRVLDGDTLVSMYEEGRKASENWDENNIIEFKRALVETGIFVRTCFHNYNCSRNEYLVVDEAKRVFKIISIIAVKKTVELLILSSKEYATKFWTRKTMRKTRLTDSEQSAHTFSRLFLLHKISIL